MLTAFISAAAAAAAVAALALHSAGELKGRTAGKAVGWGGERRLTPQSGTSRVSQDNDSAVCIRFPGLKVRRSHFLLALRDKARSRRPPGHLHHVF